MICKHCNKELPESAGLCPYCGALLVELEGFKEAPAAEADDDILDLCAEFETGDSAEDTGAEPAAEETEEASEETSEETSEEEPADDWEDDDFFAEEVEKNGLKPWQWWLTVGCALVLLTVVIGAVLYGMGIKIGPRPNDVTYKDSYTAYDDELIKKSDKVVATMGGKELTVGELQMHYQNVFFSFYSQNYYYLSFIGLDITLPLDEQYVPGTEDQTWQQYFLQQALNNWQAYVLMELVAEADGYAGSEDIQAMLGDLETIALDNALAYGYATAEEWLANEVGAGVTIHDYVRYNTAYYLGSDYLNYYYETHDPSQEEVDAYYAENQETFAANGVTPDMGLNSSVRHILIAPTGGTTDETGNTTYTEKEWEVAYTEAERILQLWKDGPATEESFTELAVTYSTDPGVATNSGLYENVNVDASYVEAFKNWAIDPARVPGDTAIVETPYGYHIMYFVSGQDYCSMVVKDQLIAEGVKSLLQTARETYPMEVNYKNIYLGEIKLY